MNIKNRIYILYYSFKAKKNIDNQRLEEALNYYNKILNIDDSDRVALLNKISICAYLGFDEKLKIIINEVFENTNDLDFWISIGQTLIHNKKFKEANECYNKILEKERFNVIALSNKALVLTELNKFKEALSCYDAALKINPKSKMNLSNKGELLLIQKKYKLAISLFNSVLDLEPKNIIALSKKAIALYDLKEYKLALNCLNVGYNVLSAKSYEFEEQEFKAAIQILNNRAIILEMYGNIQESLSMYELVLKLEPTNKVALNNRTLILKDLTIKSSKE